MNTQLFESTLNPLRIPFTIEQDGSRQTELNNHGRVGFFVERLFGIKPNCSRDPDLDGVELKTMQLGKKITVGTMTDLEYNKIVNRTLHYFNTSDPYKKMKDTLLVTYEKLKDKPVPEYIMRNWSLFSLYELPNGVRKCLQEDYSFICDTIKKNSKSRSELTKDIMDYGCYSGDYLSLVYKGDGQYNYPAWVFKSAFMKELACA
jgi:hypothetical protein